jgi:hypothetical protein
MTDQIKVNQASGKASSLIESSTENDNKGVDSTSAQSPEVLSNIENTKTALDHPDLSLSPMLVNKTETSPAIDNEASSSILSNNIFTNLKPDQLEDIIQAMKGSSEISIMDAPLLDVSISSATDPLSLAIVAASFLLVWIAVYYTHKATTKNHEHLIKSQEAIALDRNELERRKSKIEMVSLNRQNWINSLRDEVSALLASFEKYQVQLESLDVENTLFTKANEVSPSTEHRMILIERLLEAQQKTSAEKASLYYSLTIHESKINLLLNPTEPLSGDLIGAIKKLISNAQELNKDLILRDKLVLPIIEITQKILKTEWERVKSIQ